MRGDRLTVVLTANAAEPAPGARPAPVWLGGAWSSPRPRASSGTPRWCAPPPTSVVGLDFDGTLSPIVDDPAAAHIHPDAAEVLVDLADPGAAVAVVTGRPARQALDLGGLEEVGNAIGDAGKELYLFGQYGNERWTLHQPPGDLARARRTGWRRSCASCPGCCAGRRRGRAHRGEGARGRGAHPPARRTREAAYERLLPGSRELAERHELVVEPGRNVIEVRSPGHAQGGRGRDAWWRSSTPAPSSSPATTSATSRRSRRSRRCASGAADAAGLLGLGGGERAGRVRPTWWSRAPRASLTCCASSPPTPVTCGPDRRPPARFGTKPHAFRGGESVWYQTPAIRGPCSPTTNTGTAGGPARVESVPLKSPRR